MAKILIIDDERFIRASLREILEYEKYEVIEAQDGAEGLQKIKDEEVDLVLCDVKMPILDGMDVLDQVKQLDRSPQFIMISAHGTIETAVEARFQEYFVSSMSIPNAGGAAPSNPRQRRGRRRVRNQQ